MSRWGKILERWNDVEMILIFKKGTEKISKTTEQSFYYQVCTTVH